MSNSKQGNIFVSFYKSITDIDYYKNFMHMTTGKAFSYLVIVSLFFFFISMIPSIFQYKDTVDELFHNIELLPDFEISNGRFQMDSDTYHIVYQNTDIGMIVILDPVNEYRRNDLNYYQVAILLTETQLIQKSITSHSTIELSDLSMISLTKDDINRRFSRFFLTLIPVLIIYMLFFGVGVKVIACYIVHFMTIIYVMFKRIKLDRKAVFRVSCYAITLPIMIGTLLSFFRLSFVFWDWIFLLGGFLYSYNAVKKYAKDHDLYIKTDKSNF